ncbi:MAG: MBL fold metallo-hydrolase [Anaerolineales bacterium]|nr:MAG: MBL fold metallo-hydrolase [Anaerolineales bacterium]
MTKKVEFTIVNIGTLSMNKYWGETERLRTTTATCTLLRTQGINVLVDPSPYPPDLEKLLFANTGLKPEDIDIVFATHFHGDHLFGVELFPEAEWLMAQVGLDEWSKVNPDEKDLLHKFIPGEDKLPEGISLLPAPGHTFGLHALSVETRWGLLIVAGDAVMTPEFFREGEGYHNSVDFKLAAETIHDIKSQAALVIPGHGNIIINIP